jgi:hypothetical protein
MEFSLFVIVVALAFAPLVVLICVPNIRGARAPVLLRPARRSMRPKLRRGPGSHTAVSR